MAKKKKPEVYQINAPFAYVQAAESLEIAKKWALERKDHPSLIDIANSWIEIGNQMLTADVELVYDEDDIHTVRTDEQQLIGFGFLGGITSGEQEAEPSPGADED